MTSHSEPAGLWVRVSTADQTETSQVPDIERHCSARGYQVTRRYELNDKSASKGEQQAKLDAMLEDMRDGTIKVLVCWHSDRVERRGPEALFRLLRQIKDAGGRIESTKEPLLGTEDLSGEAVTAINAVIAHQESVHKSDRQKMAVAAIKANGGIYGAVPWGFDIVGEKYSKQIVPTELCKQVVPKIFERCIAGDSLRTIAAWLDSEGIPTPRGKATWHESSIRWIILARAYAGRLQNSQGQTIARCEAVVPADVFDRANQALTSRPHRGPTNTKNKPLLSKLRCANCGSPMYRVARRKSGHSWVYYRCYGSGAQRKGCGNMIPYGYLEAIVHGVVFLSSKEHHRTREWVEGQNWDAEISDVKQDMRGAVEAERFEELPELQAKLAELRSRESIPGHYEYHDTGLTVGQHFHSLDYEGQREYLKTRDIRVEKVPARDGAPVVRLVIDGRDYGTVSLVKNEAANRYDLTLEQDEGDRS